MLKESIPWRLEDRIAQGLVLYVNSKNNWPNNCAFKQQLENIFMTNWISSNNKDHVVIGCYGNIHYRSIEL